MKHKEEVYLNDVPGVTTAHARAVRSSESTRTVGYVCSCFPSHCEMYEEHGLCWCEPEIIKIGDNKIFIHREEQ
jgi:hypothetical protein